MNAAAHVFHRPGIQRLCRPGATPEKNTLDSRLKDCGNDGGNDRGNDRGNDGKTPTAAANLLINRARGGGRGARVMHNFDRAARFYAI